MKLRGRLSVLLGPLTNIIPLIGAAQLAFINPPHLELDFTGAANVADFSAIDGAVRGVILSNVHTLSVYRIHRCESHGRPHPIGRSKYSRAYDPPVKYNILTSKCTWVYSLIHMISFSNTTLGDATFELIMFCFRVKRF